MPELISLLIFSLSAVAYLFIISKLLGKKQIAQLEFVDYVMGISIGSVAAEMSTDLTDTPFYYYLISMTVFFLFDLAITYFGRKGVFKNFLKGRPLLIINEGKIDYNILSKSKLDINEVITLCRNQGYFDLQDIAFAIFENNGELSILPKGEKRPTVISDFKDNFEQPSLTTYLVVDGKIVKETLTEFQKTNDWAMKKLKISTKKELLNIILATYDEKQDSVNVYNKLTNIK